MRTPGPLLAALALITACSSHDSVGPTAEGVPSLARAGDAALVVMTRNMYVGANVDQVIGALVSPDPSDDLPTLQAAIQTFYLTDFPTRAKALAKEIDAARAHVVGLQEVSTIDLDLSGLGIPVTIHQDFLTELLGALSALGRDYVAAARVTNITAQPFPGIDVTDRDAILVDRSRVAVAGSPIERNFVQNIGTVAPGVSLLRGFVAITAEVRGRAVVIANTHLESGPGAQLSLLRAAQATELAQSLPAGGPVVILGDLNDLPGSLMHQVLTGAGFVDLWAARNPTRVGNTCCHADDLSNPTAQLTQRIDYVLARGLNNPRAGNIYRVGHEPASKVPGPAYPIWPSDHAGVVAQVVLPDGPPTP